MVTTRTRTQNFFTELELDRMGVWVISYLEYRLQCQKCGQRWWPVLGYAVDCQGTTGFVLRGAMRSSNEC